MSRIGRLPITLPAGVIVNIDGSDITVKGPKGTLSRSICDDNIICELQGNVLHFTRKNEESYVKAQHGLYRTLINNMVVGVTAGYTKALVINGVGYKAAVNSKKLVLNIGYSHTVEIDPPEGISFECPTLTDVIVKGIDKELVGQTAANIRAKRVVEPYHSYGIRYKDETVVIKEGKTNK
ncbi:MAG: 50S ribosomal protein L6 [Clostridia bacterium]